MPQSTNDLITWLCASSFFKRLVLATVQPDIGQLLFFTKFAALDRRLLACSAMLPPTMMSAQAPAQAPPQANALAPGAMLPSLSTAAAAVATGLAPHPAGALHYPGAPVAAAPSQAASLPSGLASSTRNPGSDPLHNSSASALLNYDSSRNAPVRVKDSS